MADINIAPSANGPRVRQVFRRNAAAARHAPLTESGMVVVAEILRSRADAVPTLRPFRPPVYSEPTTPPVADQQGTAPSSRDERVPFVPIAPQDLGELKHGPLDEKRLANRVENNLNVREDQQIQPPQDFSYRYLVHTRLDVSGSRRRMEDRVRRSKRVRSPCPYCLTDLQCTKSFIRCGDRLQYSVREDSSQKSRVHHCAYRPRHRGTYVLIVDDDPRMRDFCRASFALFLDYDADKILTAGSAAEGVELLRRSKVAGDRIGLVISDLVMPGRSGYDLVNELYFRNFDVEILLMSADSEELPIPLDYMGDVEILPNLLFVSGHLTKPFHSNRLVETVRALEFGRGL